MARLLYSNFGLCLREILERSQVSGHFVVNVNERRDKGLMTLGGRGGEEEG